MQTKLYIARVQKDNSFHFHILYYVQNCPGNSLLLPPFMNITLTLIFIVFCDLELWFNPLISTFQIQTAFEFLLQPVI